jgi:hypothetical protein
MGLGDIDPDPALGRERGRDHRGGRFLAGARVLGSSGSWGLSSHRGFGIQRGVDRRSDSIFRHDVFLIP